MSRRFSRPSRSDATARASTRLLLVSAFVVIAGVSYMLVGLAQLLQSTWYFDNLLRVEPFNELATNQLGAALLPLGVILVIASQRPSANRLVIGAGAATAVLLFLAQLYSVSQGVVSAGLIRLETVGVFAAVLLWSFWQVRPRMRRN